jgi:hypothetical protein
MLNEVFLVASEGEGGSLFTEVSRQCVPDVACTLLIN